MLKSKEKGFLDEKPLTMKKRDYTAPALKSFGSVREITRSGAGSEPEQPTGSDQCSQDTPRRRNCQ